MPSPVAEVIGSIVIAVLLVALGGFYSLREFLEYRRRDGFVHAPPADRRHFRRQFFRRSAGSSLLVAAGVVIFVNQVILDWQRTPRVYLSLWIGVIVALFAIVFLAGMDLVAIRRYARRHSQRLANDRREMIHRQLEQWRAGRDGTSESGWRPEHN